MLTKSSSLSVHIGMGIKSATMNRFLTLIHRYTRGNYEHDDTLAGAGLPMRAEGSNCETTRSPLDLPLHKPSCIDNEYTDHGGNPKVEPLPRSCFLVKPLITVL